MKAYKDGLNYYSHAYGGYAYGYSGGQGIGLRAAKAAPTTMNIYVASEQVEYPFYRSGPAELPAF